MGKNSLVYIRIKRVWFIIIFQYDGFLMDFEID